MRAALLLLMTCVLLASCGDSVQFADPPNRADAKAGAGKMPAGHPHVGSESVGTHGEAGGSDPFADPDEKEDNTSEKQAAPEGSVFSGSVQLASGFTLPNKYAVFVCAYPAGTSMPSYVKKYDKPAFPFAFDLTTRDAPFGRPPTGSKYQLGVIFSEAGVVTPGGGKYSKIKLEETHSTGSKDIVLTVKE